MGQRAELKVEHKSRVDRIRELGYDIPQLHDRGIAAHGGERAHEHKPSGSIGIV